MPKAHIAHLLSHCRDTTLEAVGRSRKFVCPVFGVLEEGISWQLAPSIAMFMKGYY